MLTDKFIEQIMENDEDVKKFCERYKVKLLSQEMTDESSPGVFEPMYFFSDNLGGYTIKGIIDSLANK